MTVRFQADADLNQVIVNDRKTMPVQFADFITTNQSAGVLLVSKKIAIDVVTLTTNQIPTLHSNSTHWQRRELEVTALARQTLLVAALEDTQKPPRYKSATT